MKHKFDKQMWEHGKTSGSTTGFPRNNQIDEEAPYTEKMSQRYPRWDKESSWDGKYIAKFLKSKVGQPWDSIYSEVCQSINKNSWTGHNLLDCLNWMVHKEVYFVDGVAYNTDGKRIFYGWHCAIFYVDQDGILRVKEDKRTKYKYTTRPQITIYEVGDKTFIYHNDIWYRATFEKPKIVREWKESRVLWKGYSLSTDWIETNIVDVLCDPHPVVFGYTKQFVKGDLEKKYGKLLCCRRIEAANKREIKKVKEKYKIRP